MDFAIGYYRAAILAGIRTAFPNTRPRHGPFDDPRARRDPRDPRRREKGKGGGRETVEWAGGGEGSHTSPEVELERDDLVARLRRSGECKRAISALQC